MVADRVGIKVRVWVRVRVRARVRVRFKVRVELKNHLVGQCRTCNEVVHISESQIRGIFH